MKKIDFKEFGNGGAINFVDYKNPFIDYSLKERFDNILNQPFSKEHFSKAGELRKINEIDNKSEFSNFKGIRCLDMPIKMAGSNEYKIPKEFEQFLEPIKKMVAFEELYNDNIIDFYAYLTIDQSELSGKDTHRESGLHVDGFQGARISPKVLCDRSYIVVDCDAPSFWDQSFKTVIYADDAVDNIFEEFDYTKNGKHKVDLKPFEIYFMDCYAVHSANKSVCDKRTFVRLSFSVRQYDRLGNSHNNLFDYRWEMHQRDIKSVIGEPKGELSFIFHYKPEKYNNPLVFRGRELNGIQEGRCVSFYDNEKVKCEHFYVNGRPHGVQREWHSIGRIKSISNYDNGEPIGIHKTYNTAGDVLTAKLFKKI